jgi:hypothetical protein
MVQNPENLGSIVYIVYNVYMDSKEPTSFTKSAFKHKVSELRIREVLMDEAGEEFELGTDANGDPCEMIVGHDKVGNLIEVGICYEHDEGTEVGIRVFHAWKAREQWINEYNQRK